MARWNLLYQGQWYSWQKQPRGTDARRHPSAAFVCFLENHDQVANTGTGRRLHQFGDRAKWRALSTLLLLGPAVPLLFQGQEEAVEQPFTFFADHQAPLSDLVRKGRLEFLSQFPSLASSEAREQLPVPNDEAMFNACRLDWRETGVGRDASSSVCRFARTAHSRMPCSRPSGPPTSSIDSSAPTSDIVLIRYSTGEDARLLVINLGPLTTCANERSAVRSWSWVAVGSLCCAANDRHMAAMALTSPLTKGAGGCRRTARGSSSPLRALQH